MSAGVYKRTLRLYEADRAKARALYERRKAEVYDRLPRVRELDASLTKCSLDAARSLLNGMAGATGDMKTQMNRILDEKRAVLSAAGIPPDYLTDIYTCPYCEDTGYVGGQTCRCLRQRLIDGHYSEAGLGLSGSDESFQAFDFRFYSDVTDPAVGLSPLANIRTVYEHCVGFVMNFGTSFSNLLFYGETGLGKTFLCNCIARDLLDAGVGVLYATAPRLFKKIEDFRFNRAEQESPDAQLELVYEAELLIIDDLGSEFSTVVTDTELFSIINARLLARRPTIISTNLALRDFQNAYTDRIVSRITGSYKMLRLFGDDIRFKKKLLAVT